MRSSSQALKVIDYKSEKPRLSQGKNRNLKYLPNNPDTACFFYSYKTCSKTTTSSFCIYSYREAFMSGGIYFNLLLIWECFRFSNFFPIFLSFTDKLVILTLFFIIFKRLYSSYIFLEREIQDSFYFKLFLNLGTYSLFIQIFSLLPLLIGGQVWLRRISSLYPLESFLYIKLSFLILLNNNINSFAITLLSKKIINYKIFSIFLSMFFLSIPVGIFELIKYKEETTINFFIGMF